MAHRLRELWWEVRSFLGGLVGRLGRWLDPLAGTDEVRYKSSKEIALDNAAESLGTDLGGYYLQDWEISDDVGARPVGDLPLDVQARGDAAREEMLVYVDRIRIRRRRRRRARRKRVAILTVPVLLLGLALGVAFLASEESPTRRAAAPAPAWMAQLDKLPRYGTNSKQTLAYQPAPVADNLSLRIPRGTTRTVDVARAFVSQVGMLCVAVEESTRNVVQRSVSGSCIPPRKLRQMLDEECAVFQGGGGGGGRVAIAGFAHKDVAGVVGRPQQGSGPLRIRLSRTWVPRAPGLRLGRVEPLRVFLVIAPFVHNKVSASGPDGTSDLNPYTYKLAARLTDGRMAFMKGFFPDQVAKGPGCTP